MSYRTAAHRSCSVSVMLALALPITPALAVPIVYTDFSAWSAAVSGIQTENFAASPLGALAAGSTDIGLFNVFITTADPRTAITEGGTVNVNSVNGSRELDIFLVDENTASIARFDFDTPIVAWAGDFFSTTTADRLTVTVNGTTIQFDNYLSGAGTGFLGVVDATPFSSIAFGREDPAVPDGEYFVVDNFRIASAAAVPAPATLSLLLLALGGLMLGRRAVRRGPAL